MSWNWEVHGGLFNPTSPISKIRDVSKASYDQQRKSEGK